MAVFSCLSIRSSHLRTSASSPAIVLSTILATDVATFSTAYFCSPTVSSMSTRTLLTLAASSELTVLTSWSSPPVLA
eukprot:SAG22_NODE_1335_length_4700_cov_2.556183_9_plen_76_part_01